MYKNNQLWNRYFLSSQRISYRYRKTPRYPSIYIIDLNQFLLLFLLTITKQKYFSSSPKLLFNYIVFEFTLLLVIRPRYSENYIATISCTWEWASRKSKRKPFGKATRAYFPLQLIQFDICGPMNVRAWRFLLHHIYRWLYMLRSCPFDFS